MPISAGENRIPKKTIMIKRIRPGFHGTYPAPVYFGDNQGEPQAQVSAAKERSCARPELLRLAR